MQGFAKRLTLCGLKERKKINCQGKVFYIFPHSKYITMYVNKHHLYERFFAMIFPSWKSYLRNISANYHFSITAALSNITKASINLAPTWLLRISKSDSKSKVTTVYYLYKPLAGRTDTEEMQARHKNVIICALCVGNYGLGYEGTRASAVGMRSFFGCLSFLVF